ncbi:hypothetical protein CBR_g50019 [Chara braunii]|uniref:Reverse transcriptase domain-containing protein n=1 Tax=Chara braunii TaxID=69332 RepID=A0A388K594_CHABU|nr:hypothetical protein CBR_g50019 [Chara braunii]|eukprot:GBG65228.1 hypothetical protein CBR_g50019 [Chara braunii]
MSEHPVSNLVWGKERGVLMKEWEEAQIKKSEVWADRLRVKGIVVYDRMSRETCQKLTPSRTSASMIELQHPFDKEARKAIELADLCNYATMYYKDILTSRLQGAEVVTDLYEGSTHWTNTEVRLAAEGRLDLDRPVTNEEAPQALRNMSKGKAPGIDGLPTEWYIDQWDEVGDYLVEIFNNVLTGGRLSKGMCSDVISVLFKKGDSTKIRNWRLVSLLNVSYKILAKILARRLSKYLPDLVKGDQAAFIRGRSIFDNIITAIETLEEVQSKELNVAVLLLDLEKAYDRVNWSYVLSTLQWMGFGVNFINWVKSLYTFSMAAVIINGRLSGEFSLTRSLRQGCPLAPLLFAVQFDVVLNNIREHPQIRGMPTGPTSYKVKALADDLFAVSENSVESLTALKDCLDEFSSLSEAAINWHKSVYLLMEVYKLESEWGMKRVEQDKSERFLGVQIALLDCAAEQDDILLQKSLHRLVTWGMAPHLSIFGRALVLNGAMFALLWFVGTVRRIGDQTCKQLRRRAARFIWKPYAKEEENFLTKVAWEMLCLPRSEGRLGIHDPVRQNEAMLVNWVVKACLEEPIPHWVYLAEKILADEWNLSRSGDVWTCIFLYSFQRRRIRSPLWRALIQAWRKLRPDVWVEPVTKGEVLQQSIFENPRIRGEDDQWLGAESQSMGRKWIEKGIVRIKDIWDAFSEDWQSEEEVKARLGQMRQVGGKLEEVIKAIPDEWKRLLAPETVDPPGTWYVQDSQPDRKLWELVEIHPDGKRTFQG